MKPGVREIKIDLDEWDSLYDLVISIQDISMFRNDNIYSIAINKMVEIMEHVEKENDKLYLVKDAALYLGCSGKTILRMIKSGRLKARKNGKYYYISEKCLKTIKTQKIYRKEDDEKISIDTLKLLGIVKGN